MTDTKENEEAGQDVPVAMDEDPQVSANTKTQDSPHSLPVDKTPNPPENADAKPQTRVEPDTVSNDKNLDSQSLPQQPNQDSPPSAPLNSDKEVADPDVKSTSDIKSEASELPPSECGPKTDNIASISHPLTSEPAVDAKPEGCEMTEVNTSSLDDTLAASHDEPVTPNPASSNVKDESENAGGLKDKVNGNDATTPADNGNSNNLWDDYGSESGTEEDQSAFMKELENFFKERSMEFKPPKFYGEGLNCLKLWRAVTRLGGYDKVTSCKLWRQVGESFKPPKTCTTVSWTFRGFYEKALLDYERHTIRGGELNVPITSNSEPMTIENQDLGPGRARRDAAARAMQGWHSQRLLGNGEVSDPIIKDKKSLSLQKREKQLKNIGLLKRKKPSYMEHAVKAARTKASKPQLDIAVVDVGPPADWVKINVQRTKDCYEVYALVPGLLREEVRVQSDPAGRLVISGEPEHPDNPWGVTPFKKVVTLPSRIDPHQTSAVVTLHGQLFVRVPFEQSE